MIDVVDLTYSYPGSNHPAVRALSFHIAPGEIFGFLGPSGAGKSTTQRILTGILTGYTGQVVVFGRPLAVWKEDYYQRVGVSFELPNHFLKLTAHENLRYFARLYQGATRSPEAMLAQVGLADDGHVPVGQFSKGMKNRLTVARALLHDPDLLFLDEPTAGLDPVNARRIRDLIHKQQADGKTIFLTTHDMAVAEALCDRVAFIVGGEIRAIGAPETMKRQYGRATVRVRYWQPGQAITSKEFPLKGLGEDVRFLELLRRHPVETIHTQEATLEEVFVQVTGRSLQ